MMILNKASAATLFAIAGTLVVVGCECNKEHSTARSTYSDTDHTTTTAVNTRTTHDTPRYNTPSENNITGDVDRTYDRDMRARNDWRYSNDQNYQYDRYSTAVSNEYVHDQEGVHLDRNARATTHYPDYRADRTTHRDTTMTTSPSSTRTYSATETTTYRGETPEERRAREAREARDARQARDTRDSQGNQVLTPRDSTTTYDSRNETTYTTNTTAPNANTRDTTTYRNDDRYDSNSRATANYDNRDHRWNSAKLDPDHAYSTDIYGRKISSHPANYEYTYDEQLGVYIDTSKPNRMASNFHTTYPYERGVVIENRTADRTYSEDRTRYERDREINRDMNRDMASDTRRRDSNLDSAPVFTPVTRDDTAISTTTTTTSPTPSTTVRTETTTARVDTPRTEPINTDSKLDTDKQSLQALTSNWPSEQKEAIDKLVAKYGQPTEMTSHAIVWKDKGDFLCTKVCKESVDHKFPVAHKDFLEQTVALKVPADMADDLIAFDGSLIVDRTRGTLTARCDREENNIIALNLANDILNGTKSVAQARESMTQMAMASKNGLKDSYAQKLNFSGNRVATTADPDKPADTSRANVDDEEK